jgi:hypothetical protein
MNCRMPILDLCIPLRGGITIMERTSGKYRDWGGGSERGNPRPPAPTYNEED